MSAGRPKPSRKIRARLAGNLKRLREALGYSQDELAAFSRLNKNQISNVEQGTQNVMLASLEALAKGLGCTESELLSRTGSP